MFPDESIDFFIRKGYRERSYRIGIYIHNFTANLTSGQFFHQ